jgi:hypothetical protein
MNLRTSDKVAELRQEDSELAAERQTASLAALALTIAIIVLGLYLVTGVRSLSQSDAILVVRGTD